MSPDGSAMTPGGDFYWLNKDFTWSGGSSPGTSHGHNVLAVDYGLDLDSVRTEAPGGTYPSGSMSCISCHDPHGRSRSGSAAVSGSGSYGGTAPGGAMLGNYRLLGGVGYQPPGATFSFVNPAPVAAQNPLLPFGETDVSHVDYGSGMSDWCANCHFSYLPTHANTDGSAFKHSSDVQMQTGKINRYNRYVSTDDLLGTSVTAYLQFVPFERGPGSTGTLDPTSTQGVDSNSQVMCLTCHRAHGSAFRVGARWDMDATLLVDSHPANGDGGVVGNDVLNSYYGRDIATDFGVGQKQFCDKCHNNVPPH
ncbi:MAG: hypothetical protein C0622_09830 [Desulfuromonas sp.]|nr:MAG: hypothetical protein C0622_09830 [Desulfuromonas sp.]